MKQPFDIDLYDSGNALEAVEVDVSASSKNLRRTCALCGAPHNRNYAATMIMRSRGRWWANFRPYGVDQLRITMIYPDAGSIAISLSCGQNFPGFMPSGAKETSISSFSVGSARRYFSVLWSVA